MQKRLEKLMSFQTEKPHKVLSIYLNTERSQPSAEKEEWIIECKTGFKRLQEYIEKGGDEREQKNFQKLRSKVEQMLNEQKREMKKGFILFASSDDQLWETEKLPLPVETAFFWEEQPVLHQYRSLLKKYPPSGIIVLQQDKVRLMECDMGQVIQEWQYQFDPDLEDWREHQAPKDKIEWGIAVSGGHQADELKERLEENRRRWYRKLADQMTKRTARRKWERLFLVGEKQEAHVFAKELDKKPDQIIGKNLLNQPRQQILQEVFR